MIILCALAYVAVVAGFYFWMVSSAVPAPEEIAAHRRQSAEMIYLFEEANEDRKAA